VHAPAPDAPPRSSCQRQLLLCCIEACLNLRIRLLESLLDRLLTADRLLKRVVNSGVYQPRVQAAALGGVAIWWEDADFAALDERFDVRRRRRQAVIDGIVGH